MTQLADTRTLISSIDCNRQTIQGFFGPGISSSEDRPTSVVLLEASYADKRETIQTALKHIENLLTYDSDYWLDYLRETNPILTEDHLDQIAMTTNLWLNGEALHQIRSLIRRNFDDCDDPFDILIDWLESESGIPRLIESLEETAIPDPVLALCYAFCEALDMSYAAYFMHRHRLQHKVDFSHIEQTPEEIAADLRFFNAR